MNPTPTLQERLTDVFIEMQNQASLALFDATQPLGGVFFRVDRHKEWLRCEVHNENNMASYGHFTIAARIVDGKVLLAHQVFSNVAGELPDVDHHLKAFAALLKVCRGIVKNYCQTWDPGPYLEYAQSWKTP